MNRRDLLSGLAGLTVSGLAAPFILRDGITAQAAADAPVVYPTAPLPPDNASILDVTLTAKFRAQQMVPAPAQLSQIAGYGDTPGLQVIRLQQGQWLRAKLVNQLSEHTSIHWHGIRLPNAMDGVPYMTQAPVQPGNEFTYAFQPPDTGTFFFHPHCNTIEQYGRGLVGALIVEGDETRKSDADLICAYRDWRLKPDGSFDAMMTDKGAATAGTFGKFSTVNGKPLPMRQEVPGNSDIRLRVLNLDVTRILEIGVEGAEAWVIATDGNPLDPVKLDSWKMGPAMRLDLLLRMPKAAGQKVQLVNYFTAQPVVLAEMTTNNAMLDRPAFLPAPLKMSRIPLPIIDGTEQLPLRLSAASSQSAKAPDVKLPDGEILRIADALCLTPNTFWALNGQAWPGRDHRILPAPLFKFVKGRSYIIEVNNTTPRTHPIHLHGHTFKVLSSSKNKIVPHFSDTTLVFPDERLRIAFVADNPGDWMVHCHIIEHQETGMMGYFRVA